MKDFKGYHAQPDNFRQRLHNLKLDAATSLTKLLEEWKVKHGRPDATRIEIGEQSRTHIQPINSLGPDSYITIVALNAAGVFDEDDNFFGWDDLGHENDIINVAEYADGIRTSLLANNAQLMIENILNMYNGDTAEDRDFNQEIAIKILDKLRKDNQLNPFGAS